MTDPVSEPARGWDESPLSIWRRRALSVPACLLLAGLALGAAPVWGPVVLGVDALSGQLRTRPRSRALAFFALYLGCELAGLVVAFVLWLGTLGGRLGGSTCYLAANAALQRWWTTALFRGGAHLFSVRLELEGMQLAGGGPLLLFVRHSSPADAVLAAALVANPHRLLVRYVIKRELLWDPCLDVVGRRLPNAFIERSGPRGQAEIAAIAGLTAGLDARSAVLIYPEGTRFGPSKIAPAIAALRDKGKAELAEIAAGYRGVLPPRLGGPLALLDAAPGVDVVFLEHTGFEGAASFGRLWSGALAGRTIRVRLRRIPAREIPRVARDRWLFDMWSQTDRWVTQGLSRDESAA
jgi:1-acyl-sn-glycerol-3-phosphate acyltransferase